MVVARARVLGLEHSNGLQAPGSSVRLSPAHSARYVVEYAVIVEQAMVLDFVLDSSSDDLDACRERVAALQRTLGRERTVVLVWDRATDREVLVD